MPYPPIKGDDKGNVLDGTPGHDEILGLGGNDTLSGHDGHDILDGGTGRDKMFGGYGDDTYIVDDAGDKVFEDDKHGHDLIKSSVTYGLSANVEDMILTGSANIDGYGNSLDNHIYGNSGRNFLYGGEGNDELHGGYGNDTLSGGIGNDTMFGGVGADVMNGGLGNDTYYVDQIGDVVTEAAGEGKDSVFSTISYALGSNVESLFLEGSSKIDGAGNELKNKLTGNDADNMLFGYGGDDTLVGGGGNDTMFGGEGNDGYSVREAGDKVIEAADHGMDSVIFYGDFDYTLTDNVEILWLNSDSAVNGTGNALENDIYGNAYDNVLDGGLGQDYLEGDAGDDTYYVDNELDQVVEYDGNGTDIVFSAVDFTLDANIEDLSLDGGTAVSGTGNELINTIYGNAGDNVLDGRGGADTLSGLGGNDTFVFRAGEAHGDTLYAFEGNGAGLGDVLRFEGYGTVAQGATFHQLTATAWEIASADGVHHDVITLINPSAIDFSDLVFA